MDIGQKNGATLDREGEEVRWNFEVPVDGLLFTLTVTEGEAVLYASTKSTAPNTALHEWTIPPTSSTGNTVIQPPSPVNATKGDTVTVYVTIQATTPGDTTFQLCTNEGN